MSRINFTVARKRLMEVVAVSGINGACKTIEETEFRQAMVINGDATGYTFDKDDDRPERIVKTFFAAVSVFLSKVKKAAADEAAAIVLQDAVGTLMFGAVIEYVPNTTNPDEPGSWEYWMTFDDKDIQDIEKTKKVKRYTTGDDAFKSVFDKCSYDVGGIAFDRDVYISDGCSLSVNTITQILDHEAVEGETVTLEMPGYFMATVEVENGEKVFRIAPDGHMKELVKSDVTLDENIKIG